MACLRPPFAAPATAAPTSRSDGLSDDEVRTLASLAKVDDYPLYTMRYYGVYNLRMSSIEQSTDSTWACSLFAALGDTMRSANDSPKPGVG